MSSVLIFVFSSTDKYISKPPDTTWAAVSQIPFEICMAVPCVWTIGKEKAMENYDNMHIQ